jgi:hypothetical protein
MSLMILQRCSPKASSTVEWSSGRPYDDRLCQKCIASLDKEGQLVVKEGRHVLKTFNVTADPWLSKAIQLKDTTKPAV